MGWNKRDRAASITQGVCSADRMPQRSTIYPELQTGNAPMFNAHSKQDAACDRHCPLCKNFV